MKPDFKKWLKKNNRDAEGIRIGSVMPSNDGFELFNQFAEEYAEKEMKYVNVYEDEEGRFISDRDFDTAEEAYAERDVLSTYKFTIGYKKLKDES